MAPRGDANAALQHIAPDQEATGGHEQVLLAVDAALHLATEGNPAPEKIESLGGRWVGEEALDIGLYCALASDSFQKRD